MDGTWVNRIREQCQAARVPFFFKQWGGVRKSAAGRALDGRTYDETPDRHGTHVIPERRLRLQMIDDVNRATSQLADVR